MAPPECKLHSAFSEYVRLVAAHGPLTVKQPPTGLLRMLNSSVRLNDVESFNRAPAVYG